MTRIKTLEELIKANETKSGKYYIKKLDTNIHNSKKINIAEYGPVFKKNNIAEYGPVFKKNNNLPQINKVYSIKDYDCDFFLKDY